jgi:alpha-tubulin suppressor-like RCC1 family protein
MIVASRAIKPSCDFGIAPSKVARWLCGATLLAMCTLEVAQAQVSLTDAVMVASGTNHTCALTSVGGVKCWGSNSSGELGDNTTTQRLTAVDVSGLTRGVIAISAGATHTCALTSSGGVKCWGYNAYGHLGDNSTTRRLTAVDVSGLTSGVTAISAGAVHTCALTSSGGVKCWGYNELGRLGDNSTTSRLTAVDVSGLASGVTAISAGGSHTCALASVGGVKCWGGNSFGSIGDNSTTNRLTPVDVSGLSSGVRAIATGERHTCALTSGGGAKCWGRNGNGQLGDNSTTQRLTAVDVSGLTGGVNAIAGGNFHTCAVTNFGGGKCWGANAYGQLGNNTTSTRQLTAVNVSGLTSGVSTIATGGWHACALTTAGAVLCWGSNDNGQLGDGTITQRLTPVAVVTLAPVESLLSIEDLSIVEGNSGTATATFTVSLSSASTSPVTFDIATDTGTAAPGSDYVARSLTSQTIPAGQSSFAFSVTVNGDTEVEFNETLTANLRNVTGATVLNSQGVGTIGNDDSATLSIADVALVEGNNGVSTLVFPVTLSMPMPTPVSFDITTNDGSASVNSDYHGHSQFGRVLDAGRTSQVFEVAVNGDSTVEPDETIAVTISHVMGAVLADGNAIGTIVNDDALAITQPTVQAAARGELATLRAALGRPGGKALDCRNLDRYIASTEQRVASGKLAEQRGIASIVQAESLLEQLGCD